jgi:hypothetical protein
MTSRGKQDLFNVQACTVAVLCGISIRHALSRMCPYNEMSVTSFDMFFSLIVVATFSLSLILSAEKRRMKAKSRERETHMHKHISSNNNKNAFTFHGNSFGRHLIFLKVAETPWRPPLQLVSTKPWHAAWPYWPHSPQ